MPQAKLKVLTSCFGAGHAWNCFGATISFKWESPVLSRENLSRLERTGRRTDLAEASATARHVAAVEKGFWFYGEPPR